MKIAQMEPWLGEEEQNAIAEYMASGAWLTEYKKTEELEKMLCDYTEARHCIMMPNGTLALYAILAALGIGPGDHVLVPAFTQIATVNVVKMVGAHPVFVDVEKETLCLDLNSIRCNSSNKVMMVVSINGRCPDMDRIRDFATEHDLWLIEDAAQSIGSFWNDRHLGTIGDAGILSFSTPKTITTGQGGCVLTRSDDVADRLRSFKNFGRESAGGQQDEYTDFGINLKFTDLQAVIGIEQLKKLPWRVARKKEMFVRYQKGLDGLPVQFLPTDLTNTCPWFVDILVEDREGLVDFLKKAGVGTRNFYPALHLTPVYRNEHHIRMPVSEYVSEHGLWLPSSTFLTNEEIEYVCRSIHSFYC